MSKLTKAAPGATLVSFDENVSPKISRVEMSLNGKEYQYDLTFALRCPFSKQQDFWERIRLISSVYDQLGELSTGFSERKGIKLILTEARLAQQNDPERT